MRRRRDVYPEHVSRRAGRAEQRAISQATHGVAQAVVFNAGNANACNGPQGLDDAREMARLAAEQLGIRAELVLVASTGIIGVPMPMDKRARRACRASSSRPTAATPRRRAIMTTDTRIKESAVALEIGGREVRIGAMTKGVGMIHPNMATMLAFVGTDASLDPDFARAALKRAVDRSFNMITVDGDTSTNDSCFLLANGLSGAPTLSASSADAERFIAALEAVCIDLARKMAADGEGASKLLQVDVTGAASEADARAAARAVVGSSLVKAALHGEDPNWGRVFAAVGYSGAQVDPLRAALWIGSVQVARDGVAHWRFERRRARPDARRRSHACASISGSAPAPPAPGAAISPKPTCSKTARTRRDARRAVDRSEDGGAARSAAVYLRIRRQDDRGQGRRLGRRRGHRAGRRRLAQAPGHQPGARPRRRPADLRAPGPPGRRNPLRRGSPLYRRADARSRARSAHAHQRRLRVVPQRPQRARLGLQRARRRDAAGSPARRAPGSGRRSRGRELASPIESLVEQGYVVVIAPLAAGPDSQPLNVNADTVAGEVARALGAEKLVLFTDVPGVLDADGRVMPELSREQVERMLDDGTIRGGMIPKIQACLRAMETVPRVHVLDGRVPHALIRELFTHEGVGTMLTSEQLSKEPAV